MTDKQPVYILPENVSRVLGRDAQRNNILAAKIVADIVKTTLGPKGMDKMLVDSAGNVIVTNDGVTILEEMEIDHPAAKMLVDIAKTQESEVGDGGDRWSPPLPWSRNGAHGEKWGGGGGHHLTLLSLHAWLLKPCHPSGCLHRPGFLPPLV